MVVTATGTSGTPLRVGVYRPWCSGLYCQWTPRQRTNVKPGPWVPNCDQRAFCCLRPNPLSFSGECRPAPARRHFLCFTLGLNVIRSLHALKVHALAASRQAGVKVTGVILLIYYACQDIRVLPRRRIGPGKGVSLMSQDPYPSTRLSSTHIHISVTSSLPRHTMKAGGPKVSELPLQ